MFALGVVSLIYAATHSPKPTDPASGPDASSDATAVIRQQLIEEALNSGGQTYSFTASGNPVIQPAN